MKLNEFFKLIQHHDWTHMMSDDHGVWKRGKAQEDEIFAAKKGEPLFEELYTRYHSHVWNGGPKPTMEQK